MWASRAFTGRLGMSSLHSLVKVVVDLSEIRAVIGRWAGLIFVAGACVTKK